MMSKFDEMIATMKTVGYAEKSRILEYLLYMTEREKRKFSREDKDALLAFAYEEVNQIIKVLPQTESYKQKDIIGGCSNFLVRIIVNLEGSPDNVPQDKALKMKALKEVLKDDGYRMESMLKSIFEQDTVTETDINRLLYWARQTTDEYQRGKLVWGLKNHQQDLHKLTDGARRTVAEYIASELQRLMTMDTEDAWGVLELLADVGKYFSDENVVAGLRELMTMGRNHINCFAVDTLCGMGLDVPEAVIQALARDLEYAKITYEVLRRQGKTGIFPPECATEEYLAKSDLVHWLTYPTELGKAPDEIVYLGRVKKLLKKEALHVFKYRSSSETLAEELKGKWLIGWSSSEGGSFSNFVEYAPFEMSTPEKTLKCIKRILL